MHKNDLGDAESPANTCTANICSPVSPQRVTPQTELYQNAAVQMWSFAIGHDINHELIPNSDS